MNDAPGCNGRATPVVVAGLYLPGISLLRNFTRRGIPAIGIEGDPCDIGFRTRYGTTLRCPDPASNAAGWLEFMLELGERLAERPVLIATSDTLALAIDRYSDELARYYRFPRSPSGLTTQLSSKRRAFELAAKHGLPAPRTCFIESELDVQRFASEARYPCLIKPEFSTSWIGLAADSPMRDRKVLVARNAGELVARYHEAAPTDPRLVAQEVIEGEDEKLVYWVGYLDHDQQLLGSFAGRKKRVTPPHFGSASYVETMHDPQLDRQCSSFLRALGYRGICGIEVKQDRRDGQYKLVEVNPRYGLWDEIGRHLGVDVAWVEYQDLLGKPVRAARNSGAEYRWVSMARDVRAFVDYRREGSLTVRQWLGSLRPPIVCPDLDWRDWPVALGTLWDLARGFRRRLASRLERPRVSPHLHRPEWRRVARWSKRPPWISQGPEEEGP